MRYLRLFVIGLFISCCFLGCGVPGKLVKQPSWMEVSESQQKKNPDTIYGRGHAETWTSESAIIAARANAVDDAAKQARVRADTEAKRIMNDTNFDMPEITAKVLSDIELRTDFDISYRNTHRQIRKLKDGKYVAYYGVSVDMSVVNDLIISSIEKEPELVNHLNASDLYNNFRNQYLKNN